MEVFDAILNRHSVRDFKPDPVPKATVMKILEAAIRAPSSGNSQPWNIYVAGGVILERIRKEYLERFDKGILGKAEMAGTPPPLMPKAMADRMTLIRNERLKLLGLDPADPASQRVPMANGARLFGATALIVLTMDKVLDRWSSYDLGMLTQNILLAAQASGLGSLVAQGFVNQPDIIRNELGIPDSQIIAVGIGLGYFDIKSKFNGYISPRRPIDEVVTLKGF